MPCECCPNDAVAYDGGLLIVYRNNDDDLREHWSSLLDSDDRVSSEVQLSTTEGTMNACPMQGPRVVVDGDAFAAVWSDAAGEGKLWMAWSTDGGASWGEAIEPDPRIEVGAAPVSAFVARLLGYPPTVEALSHAEFAFSAASEDLHGNMLLGAADLAFQAHLPLGLRPEVLWQVILSQVAIAVKQDPERYRSLFTRAAASETIVVRHDGLQMGSAWGWDQAIRMFEAALEERVPARVMEMARSDLTTSGETEHIATLLTFMEGASPFYDYRVVTRCGIPRVALYGQPEDWRTVRDRLGPLAELFPGLANYFRVLRPILQKLVEAAEGAPIPRSHPGVVGWRRVLVGGDPFWESVYKRSSESGGDKLSGWLTSFYAYTWRNGGLCLRSEFSWEAASIAPNLFPSSGSAVDFVWDYFGTEYPMKFVGGVLTTWRHRVHGVELFTPRLGWAVVHAR